MNKVKIDLQNRVTWFENDHHKRESAKPVEEKCFGVTTINRIISNIVWEGSLPGDCYSNLIGRTLSPHMITCSMGYSSFWKVTATASGVYRHRLFPKVDRNRKNAQNKYYKMQLRTCYWNINDFDCIG